MTTTSAPISEQRTYAPRQRDRRHGLAEWLSTLARSLDRRTDVAALRDAFENGLRTVVRARSVQLREPGHRWPTRAAPATGSESIALDVPGADHASSGLLDVTFDPECHLGDWDFQTLAMAAHVGSLVLEIERGRTQAYRSGAIGGSRHRRDAAAPLIGSTQVMEELRRTIERVAGTDFTVLLEGESGVGKELVARQIHDLSRRRNGPFVAINCAALVETLLEAELFGIEERTATGVRGRRGKFEAADGGTLFLDEVSDLSLSAQAKLLRTIQDFAVERVGGQGTHRVDIRIIAATNRSLAGLVERDLFRSDLFYRLSGVDVRVPSLRERQKDILELAHYFLKKHRTTRVLQLSVGAAEALTTYAWPGNVRELERLIERAVALTQSSSIELDDLPATVRGDHAVVLGPSLERGETLRSWGSRYVRIIVDRCQGNKRKACRALGISYHTLQAYLRYQADPGGVAVQADWTREDPAEDPAELLEESEEAGDIESAAQG